MNTDNIAASPGRYSLVSARKVGAWTVHLVFADGCEFDLDLAPDLLPLSGPLVSPLHNPEVFSQMEVQNGSLIFPTGLDYGADTLRLWCENGGVADQDLTDQLAKKHFAN